VLKYVIRAGLVTKMKPKRKPLTTQQFEMLSQVQGWEIFEIPKESWKSIPGLTRQEDTIAIMGSADVYNEKLLNKIHSIAGFDQLVFENRPHPGEPEGNAYHYVIQQTTRSDYPYILHGPFTSETRVGHWFNSDDIDKYSKE
jgi:hypothetical protein